MWQCGSKITTYHLLHITKIPFHIGYVQEWYEKRVSIYIFPLHIHISVQRKGMSRI